MQITTQGAVDMLEYSNYFGFFCSINHLSGGEVNANHITGRGRYAWIFKSRSNPARLRVMAERKGQVFVDERAIIVQLQWVWGASEQEAGVHFTCRFADSNLERIRRLLSNL